MPLSWVSNCPVSKCPVYKCPVSSCPVSTCPGFVFSVRPLKRMTKKLGLYRSKYKSDILKVVEFIWGQCNSHGQMHGYRWMHSKCLENGQSRYCADTVTHFASSRLRKIYFTRTIVVRVGSLSRSVILYPSFPLSFME